jgi:hypothetical protein
MRGPTGTLFRRLVNPIAKDPWRNRLDLIANAAMMLWAVTFVRLAMKSRQ